MKKILCLVSLVGFAYPQSGNNSLRGYPFDKKREDMSIIELADVEYYKGQIHAIITTFVWFHYNVAKLVYKVDRHIASKLNLRLRTCKMDFDQIIIIVKNYCDNNPEETHRAFVHLLFMALELKVIVYPYCLF